MQETLRSLGKVLSLCGLTIFIVASPVFAATITVTNTNDSGSGSLRQAVGEADNGDMIVFSGVTGTISLSSVITIDRNVTIEGPGRALLALEGTAGMRIFSVPSGVIAAVSGLTMTGGGIGGIQNLGTLTVADSVIMNNAAPLFGGGIFNAPGASLLVSRTTISGNTADYAGGGVWNEGTAVIADSTLSGNTSYDGGAIMDFGTMTIMRSTLSGNQASDAGGAIYGQCDTLTITESTIAGNRTSQYGGGIYNTWGVNCPQVVIGSTIVAGNSSDYADADLSGPFLSQGHNLIQDQGGAFIEGLILTDLFSLDPRLGPLADNGGPTMTHALLIGSPAINAGDDAACSATDQRGIARPQGVHCDIGAYEYVYPSSKIGIFDHGTWYLDENQSWDWNGTPTDVLGVFGVGLTGAIPVVGDWNGDGKTEIGVFIDGIWYLDMNGNWQWDGEGVDVRGVFGVGIPNAVPVTGDWNGDGKTKIGIYADGIWYLDLNSNWQWDGEGTDVLGQFGMGLANAKPVTGDWNGDGKTEIGVYADGVWYLDKNQNWQWDGEPGDTFGVFGVGLANAIPVTGDWGGTGVTKIGVYSEGNWYLDANSSWQWDGTPADTFGVFGVGLAGVTPVTGNW